MTMPHLMNCAHSDSGWCLACVGELEAEREHLERRIREISESEHRVRDKWDATLKKRDRETERLLKIIRQIKHICEGDAYPDPIIVAACVAAEEGKDFTG